MLPTINLLVEISINGAKVFPTDIQYNAIKKLALKEIFGLVEQEPKPEVSKLRLGKRKYNQTWTVEEINHVKNRRTEGASYNKIIRELKTIFGINRSTGAVTSLVYLEKKKQEKKADPNELVPSSNLPELKPNEWGGTEELKSPSI